MKNYSDYADRDKVLEAEMKKCMWEGVSVGLKWSGLGGIVGTSTVLGLHKYHQGFRTRLGVSGKTGLVASSFFIMFVLGSELTVNRCKRREGYKRLGLDGTDVRDEEYE